MTGFPNRPVWASRRGDLTFPNLAFDVRSARCAALARSVVAQSIVLFIAYLLVEYGWHGLLGACMRCVPSSTSYGRSAAAHQITGLDK